jgi:hypothetical protein
MSQIGSLAANCHEGTRSEYLAQFVFSSFGTSIPVPHPEDSGIDLYCTLLERVGRRAWPTRYFAVQVKSTDDPWHFTSPESVRWFVQFPLPLFFCVVTKREARLRVYHTSPRFYAWSSAQPITACTLVPGPGTAGHCTQWAPGGTFSLSAPVLDFTVSEALDEEFHARARGVLERWIEIDECNLHQVRTGLRQFAMPPSYVTNEAPPRPCAVVVQGKGKAHAEELREAVVAIADQLDWVTRQLAEHGDLAGALRGALLFRHLFRDQFPIGQMHFLHTLSHQLGLAGKGSYLFAGLDAIDTLIAERFPVPGALPAPTTFGGRIQPPPTG